jgi:hypothetical protein
MATKTEKEKKGNGDKPKAQRVGISQLVILNAYGKTFSSGKPGFFGKGMDPQTGKRYQIIGAVEIAS